MYSKGPLICRNISIQNRQMLLRFFFLEQNPKYNGKEMEERRQKQKKKLKKKKEKKTNKKKKKFYKLQVYTCRFFMSSDLTRMRGNRAGRLACVTKGERKNVCTERNEVHYATRSSNQTLEFLHTKEIEERQEKRWQDARRAFLSFFFVF